MNMYVCIYIYIYINHQFSSPFSVLPFFRNNNDNGLRRPRAPPYSGLGTSEIVLITMFFLTSGLITP